MRDLINLAAKVVGSQSKLAEALAVTQQNISYWKGAGIPIEYGAEIERVTNGVVTRKALWPETWKRYWPELAQAPANIAQPATENVAHGAVDPTTEHETHRTGAVRRHDARRENDPLNAAVGRREAFSVIKGVNAEQDATENVANKEA